ncbi:hypothetical protein [Actinacidiphila soli]|nr:hypothetical protein [Actinacidiphila soli]
MPTAQLSRRRPPRRTGLTEDSTLADYLRVDENARGRFLTHEFQIHTP